MFRVITILATTSLTSDARWAPGAWGPLGRSCQEPGPPAQLSCLFIASETFGAARQPWPRSLVGHSQPKPNTPPGDQLQTCVPVTLGKHLSMDSRPGEAPILSLQARARRMQRLWGAQANRVQIPAPPLSNCDLGRARLPRRASVSSPVRWVHDSSCCTGLLRTVGGKVNGTPSAPCVSLRRCHYYCRLVLVRV